MKRTVVEKIDMELPLEIARFTEGARLFDSSCSPEARVWLVDKDNGYYLKTCGAGTLKREAEMTAYFHKKGLGVEVLEYISSERDWLLCRRAEGEDCTHAQYLSDPTRLCDTIATELRKLHETDFAGCPVQDRMKEYFALVKENYKTGNYDKSSFPDSFGYRSAEEAWSVLKEGEGAINGRVLLHGDYCLPNIMLDNWKFSKFIDLGNGGVGDRHVDLFWGAWTLWFNLKTDKYRDRFFDAYGRDKVDEEKIKIIAAAEVFG